MHNSKHMCSECAYYKGLDDCQKSAEVTAKHGENKVYEFTLAHDRANDCTLWAAER